MERNLLLNDMGYFVIFLDYLFVFRPPALFFFLDLLCLLIIQLVDSVQDIAVVKQLQTLIVSVVVALEFGKRHI